MAGVITLTPVSGATIASRVARYYNDKASSDVTFIVGSNATQFFGHTFLIGAASEVFKTNFSGDWKDTKVITLGDVDEEAFRVIMLYIYTDTIQVKPENLLDVLEVAHRYMITGLIKSLTNKNALVWHFRHVWKYLTFAMNITNLDLMICCVEIIEKFATSLLAEPDFLEVELRVISLFIAKNGLQIKENTLFQFLLKWSEAECRRRDPPLQVTPFNQRKVMESFIHKIRFPIMTLSEFASVEKTGILTAREVELIKIAITSGNTDMTEFDSDWRHTL